MKVRTLAARGGVKRLLHLTCMSGCGTCCMSRGRIRGVSEACSISATRIFSSEIAGAIREHKTDISLYPSSPSPSSIREHKTDISLSPSSPSPSSFLSISFSLSLCLCLALFPANLCGRRSRRDSPDECKVSMGRSEFGSSVLLFASFLLLLSSVIFWVVFEVCDTDFSEISRYIKTKN